VLSRAKSGAGTVKCGAWDMCVRCGRKEKAVKYLSIIGQRKGGREDRNTKGDGVVIASVQKRVANCY